MQRPHIHVFLGISLDGCIAGAGHSLQWLEAYASDPPETTGYTDLIAWADTVLMGRHTWEAIEGMAPLPFTDLRLAVLTHRPLKTGSPARSVQGPLEDVLQQLWNDGARRVYLDGGDVVRQALQRGLVDRLTLTWVPMVLGDGIRLFDSGLPTSRWTREAVRTLPSGLVQVQYAPVALPDRLLSPSPATPSGTDAAPAHPCRSSP